MIIETRYRDIPWEEARQHVTVDEGSGSAWQHMRGNAVSIIVPAYTGIIVDAKCQGPFYLVVDDPGVICPHIAEIGD